MSGNEGEALKLLPQDRSEFASKSYWDGFFNKLKKNDGPKEQRKKHPLAGGSVVKPPGEEEDSAFEWYGEWPDIDKVVLANSDVDKQVLVVGCGNSQLSEQMSEAGFMIVTSIDFSQVVIDEMKAKTQGKMGLQFLFMDMLNMDPEWDERFGTVVDKGTLDALLADDKPETLARGVNMLEEVIRVLETGGMYFCVTLAQDHVRKLLLEQFPLGSNFDVSLYAFEPKMGSVLQPFLFAIRKRDSPGTWKLYMEPGQDSHTTVSENVDAITEAIDDRRLVYHMRGKLKSTSGVGLKAKFALWGENSTAETPRYLVSVVDSGLPTARQSLPCGVFLPPQGREHEWMFATEDGQVKLAQSNGIGRLIVASMERGHTFDTIQAVQAELNPAMDSLFPPGLDTTKFQVPYLTAGEDLGSRNVLHTTGSSESGELSIEEVIEKDHVLGRDFVHRRLIFVNNACAVQSEARMMNNPNKSAHGGKSKSKGGKKKKKSKAESDSSSTTKVVDSRYLAFEFHRAMIAALFMLRKHDSTTDPGVSTLVVGLGSGALAGYLATQLSWLREPVTVDAVELDPTVIDVATKWFDFGQVADKVNVTVQEGVSFLREPSNGRSKYTCVFIDVDSKDLTQPVLFPPLSFLEEDLLIHLKESVLDEHRGMLVLNLACKSEPKLEEMLGRIRGVYENVLCIPLTEFGDCNYVVIASVQSVPDAKKQVTEGKKRAYELAQAHNNGNPCAAFPHDFEEVLGDCKVVMETGKIQVL